MKTTMIVDNAKTREMEKELKQKLVGKELIYPNPFQGIVNGIIRRDTAIPGVFVPVWVNLPEECLQEVEPAPLEKVLEEAAARRLG